MGWGLCTIAGVAGKGETLDIVPRFLITGRRVAGSSFGGVKGRDQVPELVDRYLAGDIDVDSFISHRITLDEVRHIARLAHLGLSDEQAAAIGVDLNSILDHMDAIARVDTTGVAEYTAGDGAMPLRADHGPAMPLAARPETFAPAMRDGFFVVPRLATHEDAEP